MDDLVGMQASYYDEAEEFGDGFSNEFQRAFFVSSLTHRPRNDVPAAHFLRAIGRFPVLEQFEVCCPITDGLIGYSTVLIGHFATEAAAQEFTTDKLDAWVFNPQPVRLTEPAPEWDDAIPF